MRELLISLVLFFTQVTIPLPFSWPDSNLAKSTSKCFLFCGKVLISGNMRMDSLFQNPQDIDCSTFINNDAPEEGEIEDSEIEDIIIQENIEDILHEMRCKDNEEASAKYFYHFDSPTLMESGYVKISERIITLFIPNKKNSPNDNIIMQTQNVSLFINNQQAFSYQWLPITSLNDLYKIKDMLNRCYNVFTQLSEWQYYDHSLQPEPYRYYNEIVTKDQNKYYSIECFENMYNTSINVNTTTTIYKCNSTGNDIKFNIFIGDNLIFCSVRDFKNMPLQYMYSLLNLIMYKLIKY